jgi:hypothetical protein
VAIGKGSKVYKVRKGQFKVKSSSSSSRPTHPAHTQATRLAAEVKPELSSTSEGEEDFIRPSVHANHGDGVESCSGVEFELFAEIDALDVEDKWYMHAPGTVLLLNEAKSCAGSRRMWFLTKEVLFMAAKPLVSECISGNSIVFANKPCSQMPALTCFRGWPVAFDETIPNEEVEIIPSCRCTIFRLSDALCKGVFAYTAASHVHAPWSEFKPHS